MPGKRDYYESLGVNKDATPEQIKQAFYRLAKQHHPDRGGDAEKFKEINEAYQVLSDQQKRAQYDQFGFEGMGDMPTSGFSGQGFSFFDDLFGDLFGGLGGMGGRRGRGGQQVRRQVRGEDIEATMNIDFKEAVYGVKREFQYERDTPCDECEGTGAEHGSGVENCPTCKGSGQVARTTRTPFGMMQQVGECSNCGGEGKIIKKKCSVCRGRKVVRSQEKVMISIPGGVDEGMHLKVQGHGQIPAKDAIPGDLFVKIHIKPDNRFERDGYDILTQFNCNFAQAIIGCETTIETIDGPAKIKIPAGTQSGDRIRLRDKGFMNLENSGRTRGSQIVTVRVDIPKYSDLTSEQKRIIDQFIEISNGKKK